ncbi:MAG: 4-phosphoerythronate dehydrogenase [Gammaproteobacteria bacterium]|nr:4-phosphoerythronate dehydrogenase [Gammaproteobacteria bacterium]
MKILADENMPLVKELFSQFGKIVKCEGREISADKLKDANVLLVRSITRVNKDLLQNSSVSFVGTATIGVDHMDTDWLDQQNITYVNAPGCNSIAVAEYVLSGLFVMAEKYAIDLRNSKVGIIGAGNVGSAVANSLDILGIPYGLFDPPLEAEGDQRPMMNAKELQECEFITIHVPFTTADESQWPTDTMVDKNFFNRMQGMKFILNTSRGHVMDGKSLKDWLNSNKQHQAILDVWENEPFIDKELVEKCILSTPHIAGHTREGKLRGTLMLYHAFCKHFEFEDTLDDDEILNRDLPKDMIHLFQEQNFMEALSAAIWKVYDIRDDDKALRGGLTKDMPKHFDRLRKGYKVRREFSAHRLDPVSLPDGSRRTLIELGFKTCDNQESRN